MQPGLIFVKLKLIFAYSPTMSQSKFFWATFSINWPL